MNMEIYKNLSLCDLEGEEWRDVVGFEGLYQVSNLGRIKSLQKYIPYKDGRLRNYPEKILKQNKVGRGYLYLSLYNNDVIRQQYVHRLVAQAFIVNANNFDYINHIDGCKTNNCVSNLEWCNNSMNMKHAYMMGLIKPNTQNLVEAHSKKVVQLTCDCTLVAEFNSVKDAAHYYGYNLSNIARVCRREKSSKTYKGYIWRYKKDYESSNN